MWNYLSEKFTTEYFLCEAILRSHMDKQAFFSLFGKIFMLTDEELSFLNVLFEGDNISQIRSENDYMRFQRSKKYFALSGIKMEFDGDEDIAITLKGKAIGMAKVINSEDWQTKLETEENLLAWAASGNIAALRLVGLMMFEGIFFTQDKQEGLRYLRMAAGWNDITSLLYALHFDKAYTRRYIGKLNFLLKNAAHCDILHIIWKEYDGCECSESREAKLLEKLFCLKTLQRETYSAPHARALFSRAISYKDKEKLLYTAGNDYLQLAGDLPLKLGSAGLCGFDFAAISDMPLKREDEQNRIITCLENSDLRITSVYRPLCISSDSVCLLQMYADAVARCAVQLHTEYINVNELNLQQFEHTKNNVFIRSCDEDKENIYLMFFTGNIEDEATEQAEAFLRSEGRAHFHINTPNINIDLSCILPVCFCDLKNEKKLSSVCDVIRIAPCGNEEKPQVLQYIIERKAMQYGIPKIELQDRLKDKLLLLSLDEMERELNAEICANRKKGVKLTLTEDNYTITNNVAGGSRYGFGGVKK